MTPLKIIMSRGPDIKIDHDEIPKILAAISTGGVVRCKQGTFNPSFYVSIVEDTERDKEKEVDERGAYTGRYIATPLKDIFKGIKELEASKKMQIE